MSQAFSDNTWVGFGAESTWGTSVSRTKFFEFQSESLKLEQGRESRKSLRGRTQGRRGQMKRNTGGTVDFDLQVNGMELLFKHAMGSVNTTGSGPYTHTFSLARALPTGLTVEKNIDSSNIGGSSAFLYPGCNINKLTLKHSPGEFLKCSVDLVGNGVSSLVAVSTPTFATFVPFDWGDFTSCTINSVAATIKSLDELVIDNNLATDRYNLGSLARVGLGAGGPRKVSGKITLEFASLTELNYFRNQNFYSIVFVWTTGTSTLTITVSSAEFTEGDPVVSGDGPISFPLSFEAYNTTEGSELSVVLVNDTAGPVP